MDHGSQGGQQQPGTGIIDGSAGYGNSTQIGAQQITFLQNARQHRKSCDAHGRAYEHGKVEKGNMWSGKPGVQQPGQRYTHDKGHEDTEIAGKNYHGAALQEAVQIDFKAHNKHEEQDAQLAQSSKSSQ